MKNLIFVALLVSVMLVLAVGTASAGFVAGDGDTRYDRAQEASSSVIGGEVETGGESGGSGGPIVILDDGEISRFDNSSLRFRLD